MHGSEDITFFLFDERASKWEAQHETIRFQKYATFTDEERSLKALDEILEGQTKYDRQRSSTITNGFLADMIEWTGTLKICY